MIRGEADSLIKKGSKNNEGSKKPQINDMVCKQIALMRRGGANQTEIGKLIGLNPSTVSRIERAGFDYRKYLDSRREEREKEKQRKQEPETPDGAEEQVPGQIEMDLITAAEKPAEMSEQVKMMRFQAGQIDKLVLKLDHINDTLSQILRVIKKEA